MSLRLATLEEKKKKTVVVVVLKGRLRNCHQYISRFWLVLLGVQATARHLVGWMGRDLVLQPSVFKPNAPPTPPSQ